MQYDISHQEGATDQALFSISFPKRVNAHWRRLSMAHCVAIRANRPQVLSRGDPIFFTDAPLDRPLAQLIPRQKGLSHKYSLQKSNISDSNFLRPLLISCKVCILSEGVEECETSLDTICHDRPSPRPPQARPTVSQRSRESLQRQHHTGILVHFSLPLVPHLLQRKIFAAHIRHWVTDFTVSIHDATVVRKSTTWAHVSWEVVFCTLENPPQARD